MNPAIQVLAAHKKAIDADIAAYTQHLEATTASKYGKGSQLALNAYCDILSRGGKRLRGALVIEGYKMCGGTNEAMILQAARAIEMIHAYLLVIDDIQDRSVLRRGGPSAHMMLKKVVKDQHLAETLATNAALLGCHAAMMILANLDTEPLLRSNVLSILNRTLTVTYHGQTNDSNNESRSDVSEQDVYNVQEWKTATYTILNPIHVGMVLAGADCHATDGVTPYAMAAGQAFQIIDDVIGTFGKPTEIGKGNMGDICEGKKTLMVVYALGHAQAADKKFLLKSLGNRQLTAKDFERCEQVLIDSGAKKYAQTKAQEYVNLATQSIDNNKQHWSVEGTAFLAGLAQFLQDRSS